MRLVRNHKSPFEEGEQFDLEQEVDHINMYVSGQKDTLEISFDEVVLREVIDQFGQDHPVKKDFENRYHLTIEDVLISDGLIGWLMMLQDHVKVIKPYSLQEEMKKRIEKMLSFGLVAAMSLTMLAGCGNSKDATNDTNVSNGQEEKKPTGDVKIGVLVQDVSGEEALGFRSYYENYIADQYGVTFTYTDELKDAASEKSAIEKFASQGYQAVISFSKIGRASCRERVSSPV